MNWKRELAKARAFCLRSKPSSEIDEEILCHLRMEEEENLRAGMPSREAHYAALRRFGNVTFTKEESSDMWTWSSLEALWQDIRFGVRQLQRNRSFAGIAVLTLALGMGATTAIFSVVNSVLLQPLPFKNPDQLLRLTETEEAPGDFPLCGADYLDWQAQNHTFGAMSLYSWGISMSASGVNQPESAIVLNTQANLFNVLGVRPLQGRGFLAGEDRAGNTHVAILSYAFWQRRFAGSDAALGSTLRLNGESYTIVGVMPASFRFARGTEVWTPLDMSAQELGPRGNHGWNAIGRMKPGVAVGEARGDLLNISKRLEKQYPGSNSKVHAVVTPLKDSLVGGSTAPLLLLLGAVTLVLLVACVNVANLQLARASARHREMAVRTSLGAGRGRLLRQLLTESVLLSLAGATLGIAGAWVGVRVLKTTPNIPIVSSNPIEIDGTVLLFTLSVSLFVGVLFGLAPALGGSEATLSEQLKAGAQAVLSGGRRSRGLRNSLVVAEISLTVALLVGAGLLLRSFAHLRNADIGVDPTNVATMSINLPKSNYPTLDSRKNFFDRLIARVQQTSGVQSVALSTEIPLVGGSNGYINVEGERNPELSKQLVGWNYITADYFRTLGIPLLAGRLFTPADTEQTAMATKKVFSLYQAAHGAEVVIPSDLAFVAIISESTARTFWRNQTAVGKVFRWNGVNVTVIGVVRDVKEYGIRSQAMPQAYYPFPLALADDANSRLTLRTRLPPLALVNAIRHELQSLDSGLALFEPRTMYEVMAGDTRDITLQATLLGAFAVVALVLASVGLYGVMSYLVTQRTREIGIRMALGAPRSNVLNLILQQGTKLTLLGLGLGVLAALALTRSMSSLLYGVGPADPLTFVSVAALLALTALMAYYIPARRASKIDPILALRHD